MSIFDPGFKCDIIEYLRIGVPNMVTLIIEFLGYELTVIYLGQIDIAK